jgi:hypothetical protein
MLYILNEMCKYRSNLSCAGGNAKLLCATNCGDILNENWNYKLTTEKKIMLMPYVKK